MSDFMKCSICYILNDQLLMISCGHDPCIECASTHYCTSNESLNSRQSKQWRYICQVCLSETKLEKQTIQQLCNYYKNQKRGMNFGANDSLLLRSKSLRNRIISKNTRNQQYNKESVYINKNAGKSKSKSKNKQMRRYKLVSSQEFDEGIIPNLDYFNHMHGSAKNVKHVKSSSNLKQLRKSQQIIINFCETHQDQKIDFYCFGCNRAICVECALHQHKGHQIQSVKRCGKSLKCKYQKLIQDSEKQMGLFEEKVREVQKQIQSFKEWNKKQCRKLRQIFCDLAEIINRKEISLIGEIKAIQSKGIKMLENSKKQYQQLIYSLKSKKKQIKSSISTDVGSWNIPHIQSLRLQLLNLISSTPSFSSSINHLVSFNSKKASQKTNGINSKSTHEKQVSMQLLEYGLQYADSRLIVEATAMIKELVKQFKIAFKNMDTNQEKSKIKV